MTGQERTPSEWPCAFFSAIPTSQPPMNGLIPRRGRSWEGQVSERGVWIFEFAQLRNGVAHGYDIQPDEYLYHCSHHVNRAETELRLAILASVADELDRPALRISDRFSRLLELITADAIQGMQQADKG